MTMWIVLMAMLVQTLALGWWIWMCERCITKTQQVTAKRWAHAICDDITIRLHRLEKVWGSLCAKEEADYTDQPLPGEENDHARP